MKKILFDCDSTVGLPGKPMDDALALLYLLGRPEECQVLGITCTFGNGTADEVFASTTNLLRDIGCRDIPLHKGANPGEDPRSDAARFLVQTICANPGQITLMGIGSLTNLYGAWLLDNTVFEKVKEIILMGGYTAPVFYHTRHLEELNFSVNAQAAACVLRNGRNISILTGNNTLEPSYLPKEEFMEKLCSGGQAGRYIAQTCGYRFDQKALWDGAAASYGWDVVASVYALHPELYRDAPTHCFVTENTLRSGWLGVTRQAPDTCLMNLPQVRDLAAYRREMYDGWLSFRKGDAK